MVAGHADLRDDIGTAAVLRQEPSRDVQQDSERAAESLSVHVSGDILVLCVAAPSRNAFDMCSRLLTRDPEKRLGSGSFEEVMSHPWFRDIDWDKLYKKEVVPPFKPIVSGADDVRNVDSEFLGELPAVTPTFEGKVLTDPNAFTGFSYNPNQMN